MKQDEKAIAFRDLHAGDPFVIPNPWDAGSARLLAELGFQALATTSSGFAMTLGRHDGEATLDEVVEHAAALDRATDLPVSVDFENGYSDDAEGVARSIARIAESGAVGASIEDWSGSRIYDLGEAVERVTAAVEERARLPFPFMLTARADNYMRDNPDLDDTIMRLLAFQEAGADVLYAPGPATIDEIRAVCSAVTRPVNVLAREGLTFAQIAEAGAQRVSVGGSLAYVGVRAAREAATAIRDRGDFSLLYS
jgi:2-methylisocitrate lyase-like PEP mutase family enzyme